MALILFMAGVEVSLLTWKMLDVGLRSSLHSLTATYELVHHYYTTFTFMRLSNPTP